MVNGLVCGLERQSGGVGGAETFDVDRRLEAGWSEERVLMGAEGAI